jgi:hypothetical protein
MIGNEMEDKTVHMAHCNMGDYLGSCKYGEDKCPAMTYSDSILMVEWNRLPQYMRKIGDIYLDSRSYKHPDISAFALAILSCEEYKGKKDLNIVHDMVVLRRNWLNDWSTGEWYHG